jgi:hypothetical protein
MQGGETLKNILIKNINVSNLINKISKIEDFAKLISN